MDYIYLLLIEHEFFERDVGTLLSKSVTTYKNHPQVFLLQNSKHLFSKVFKDRYLEQIFYYLKEYPLAYRIIVGGCSLTQLSNGTLLPGSGMLQFNIALSQYIGDTASNTPIYYDIGVLDYYWFPRWLLLACDVGSYI